MLSELRVLYCYAAALALNTCQLKRVHAWQHNFLAVSAFSVPHHIRYVQRQEESTCVRRTLMSSLLRPGTSAVMVKRSSFSSTCTGGSRAAAVARLGRPASACLCAPVRSLSFWTRLGLYKLHVYNLHATRLHHDLKRVKCQHAHGAWLPSRACCAHCLMFC